MISAQINKHSINKSTSEQTWFSIFTYRGKGDGEGNGEKGDMMVGKSEPPPPSDINTMMKYLIKLDVYDNMFAAPH